MGLRGQKPSPAVAERNRRIWRSYLLQRVLGYDDKVRACTHIASEFGMTGVAVLEVINTTSPIGCYNEVAN